MSVRGAKPGAELWSLTDVAPVVIQRKPQDDASDGEDLRVDWVADHWSLASGGGHHDHRAGRPRSPIARVRPAARARPADPGEGGFNPFTAEAASAPAAAPADDGLPWTWIGVGVAALAAIVSVLAIRRRDAQAALRKPPSY